MTEIEIHTTKKYAKYLKPHLEEEHPKTRGHIEVETEKKRRCKIELGTVFTGEF